MDEHSFKQRIVGAIVLVALAVIFIPMLLSGGRDGEFIEPDTTIPAMPPELDAVQVLEIDNAPPPALPPGGLRVPVDKESPAATPSAPAATPKLAHKPSPPKATKKPEKAASGVAAWAVQVGSFSRRKNALALEAKLKRRGYPAFVEQVVLVDGSNRYRVRVGPWVRKAEAERQQQRLRQQFKLKGLVVRHPD